MEKLEQLLEWGGIKKDILCLIIAAMALCISIFDFLALPFDAAWIAILLCGVPILLEAFIGLVTAFDIKADVLVSLALIASVCHWGRFCRRGGGVHHAARRACWRT